MKISPYRNYVLSTYISTATTGLIGFLNWKNGYTFEDILIHIVLVFALIFVLLELSIFLFDRCDIWKIFDSTQQKKDLKLKLVDKKKESQKNLKFTGQIEPSLSLGLPDEGVRAEIKQRMGLN